MMKHSVVLILGLMILALAPASAQSGQPTQISQKPYLTISANQSHPANLLAFSPDGRWLATVQGNDILLSSAQPGTPLQSYLPRRLTGHRAEIVGLAFSDFQMFVSISLDQAVNTWGVDLFKLGDSKKLNLGIRSQVVIAPGPEPLAADVAGAEARLWNYRTGKLLHKLPTSDSGVSVVTFTPDGKSLVTVTAKGVLRVLDVATWNVTRSIDLDTPVRSLAASAEHIALGYDDGTVAILNFGDQTSIPEARKQNGPINAIAFSADGRQIASASADGTVMVWTETLRVNHSLKASGAAELSVAFSPDGKRLAAGDATGAVNCWDLTAR